jgi:hypothetical protein
MIRITHRRYLNRGDVKHWLFAGIFLGKVDVPLALEDESHEAVAGGFSGSAYSHPAGNCSTFYNKRRITPEAGTLDQLCTRLLGYRQQLNSKLLFDSLNLRQCEDTCAAKFSIGLGYRDPQNGRQGFGTTRRRYSRFHKGCSHPCNEVATALLDGVHIVVSYL